MSLLIHTIHAFRDNYIWLLQPEGTKSAYVVDPGDAVPVLRQLDILELSLNGILITHHHPDHVGGTDELLSHYSVPIFGPEGIKQVTHVVQDMDTLNIANYTFQVISIPGHTLDHIAYYSADAAILFCGDTLFSNGCGRLFEGTPKQMFASLSLLSSLPPETKVYCGHEYTEANTRFAITVEPGNKSLQKYAEEIRLLRIQNKPTIPSTIGLELATNPFLRAAEDTIQDAAKKHSKKTYLSTEETFATIRKWKDSY
jgi:hydroxyacylglutathione hydrolase|tara:strand:- start:14085 stop:14852 length:768 start_codon:yes stop_codon:yes gene_type:complete